MAAQAEHHIAKIITKLKLRSPSPSSNEITSLLNTAQMHLMDLGALLPTASTPPHHLALSRSLYEQAALAYLNAKDTEKFESCVDKLYAYYFELPQDLQGDIGDRNKVLALYLLHLSTDEKRNQKFAEEIWRLDTFGVDRKTDRYLAYADQLHSFIQAGFYDLAWKAITGGQVPSKEFLVFAPYFIERIRDGSAANAEVAYEDGISLASAKALLRLDSEGAVVEFARSRGWPIKDGYIYPARSTSAEGEDGDRSQSRFYWRELLANMIEDAKQLETIV
ncbi:26S proteasome regulatory subunit rpn12-like protein [Thermochaetoides thermophila DSM 1495]|uniref:26S proteasome regulatory subunit rpn12-like protein n=1 Tax=Chaetomium thermophilum (strain DSM 1495 / CBS 144.50 / IMI 039719) TaxID=759272 RepID=G0SB60_CHATD|nr:26S proteasome regulatory subunit rpn12-like protein [Thermochaetoides thermophila DSM 1495]EGS19440.1 26S proteasome regulatory subunit rpn12-like protein [Thermochaetoides thermophila DSM 1495]